MDFSKLGAAIYKFAEDTQKAMRLASYRTLTDIARESRKQVILSYPKNFPDDYGYRRNQGIPKQVVYDHNIDKSIRNEPSIHIYASDKISFMDKQEFGGSLNGGSNGATAAVPFSDSMSKMRSGTKGMKEKYSVKTVFAAAKQAAKSSLKEERKGNRIPKPFFMTTKSLHTMMAIRVGKERKPVMPLYHFDRKRTLRPRFDFYDTVEGVVVSSMDEMWDAELKKALKIL